MSIWKRIGIKAEPQQNLILVTCITQISLINQSTEIMVNTGHKQIASKWVLTKFISLSYIGMDSYLSKQNNLRWLAWYFCPRTYDLRFYDLCTIIDFILTLKMEQHLPRTRGISLPLFACVIKPYKWSSRHSDMAVLGKLRFN